jgi:hypothetical protein
MLACIDLLSGAAHVTLFYYGQSSEHLTEQSSSLHQGYSQVINSAQGKMMEANLVTKINPDTYMTFRLV